jgi:hypothetical protein
MSDRIDELLTGGDRNREAVNIAMTHDHLTWEAHQPDYDPNHLLGDPGYLTEITQLRKEPPCS